MRGRKRKQNAKSEKESKVETTNVQESQSSNNSEKIVPSFGKKKKVSNVETRSAKTGSGILEPRTQTTTVDIHREEAHPKDEQASASTITRKVTKSTSKESDVSSKDLADEAKKENENASTETIQANPEASSDVKDSSDQGIHNLQNKSQEQRNELAIVPDDDALEILKNPNTNKRASGQIFVPEVRNIRSLQFDPSGDAKPYQNITKDAPNITKIFDEIGKPTRQNDSTESLQKSVIKDASSLEKSAELRKVAHENVAVTVLINTDLSNDDNGNTVVTNTALTNYDGNNERAVVTNTALIKDDNADENVVVTNTAATKDDANQSDASPTLRDLSYEEESQESVVEIHKLLDYNFENFPKLAETKRPVFGLTKDCMNEGLRFFHDAISQRETSVADESPSSHKTDVRYSDNDCTQVNTTGNAAEPNGSPIEVAQCSKDRSPCPTCSALPTTPDVPLPPTQGFGIHGIDYPITATQNFNISYSPLISITPDSSNPGSPGPLPDKDVLVGSILDSNSIQETCGAQNDNPRKTLEEPSAIVEAPYADTEERPDDRNQEMRSKTNQNSEMTTKILSVPGEEDMNMEGDFGISDSQMCAIDYEEPMVLDESRQQESLPQRAAPLQGAVPLQGAAPAYVSRPDQEGHNIMQGLIKDISGLNKMLLKTKRDMEAFRRTRGFNPLQNRNWHQ